MCLAGAPRSRFRGVGPAFLFGTIAGRPWPFWWREGNGLCQQDGFFTFVALSVCQPLKKLRQFLSNFLKVSLPTLVVLWLLLELFFRWGISASERPDGDFDADHLLVKFDSTAGEGTYTIGPFAGQQGRWHINNRGWNNLRHYQLGKSNKTRIAIIGDSFVESFQVDVDKSFHHLMAQQLGDGYECYSFGWSGSPLSHYLHVGRYVKDTYQPDIVVVNLVHNDFVQSLAEYNPYRGIFKTLDVGENIDEVDPVPYHLPWMKQVLKNSAVFRYLHYNLKFETQFRMLFDREALVHDSLAYMKLMDQEEERIRRAATYSIEGLHEVFADQRLIFVMDCPRPSVYAGKMEKDWQYRYNQLARELVTATGAEFIDLADTMKEDFAKNQQPFNTELDLHWNEYGHEVVARRLLQQLQLAP